MLWVIGSLLAIFFIRFLWQSYVHPANVMTRQAANMNWVAIGRTANPNGGKDVLLGKNGLVSKIDWRTGAVRIVKPTDEGPFADYLAIERWLALRDKEIHDAAEAYVREKKDIGEMAKAQEEKFAGDKAREREESEPTEAARNNDKLYQFMLAVQERLLDGPGGESLRDIDQNFRLTSPEYLKITTELFQTAIDLGKSPTEVSTYLIMAFTAASEEKSLEPITSVIVYLRSVINYLRNPI